MRVAATHAFQLNTPACAAEAGYAEILARRSENPPPRNRSRALDDLIDLRTPAEDEGGDARVLRSKLESLRRSCRIFGHFADNPGDAGMPEALLHREQHVCIAPRLDVDDPVRMQAGKMERGGEQVAQAQAPQDRTIHPGEDAGQEDRRAGVVGKIGAAGNFVQSASGNAHARQTLVQFFYAKRDCVVPRTNTLDLRDTRS